MKTQDRKGISLRTKIVSGLAAIFLVTLVSIGVAAGIGQWTLTAFDTVLEENASCYTVQDALKAETRAFERYVRESSQENAQELAAACDAAEASLAALPFDYAELGEERYARTWNLLQGYAGYRQSRDAFLQQTAETDGYVEEMYRIMDMQDYLSEYALRLTQATLERESADYQEHAQMMQRLPGMYGVMLAAAVVLMALILKMLTSTVVVPLLQLVQASRSIAENDFSGEDLPVKTTDEVGQLTGTFNQMKHAMADYVAALTALHREEMRNLALEKDLEHTRLEVLKSQEIHLVLMDIMMPVMDGISAMVKIREVSNVPVILLTAKSEDTDKVLGLTVGADDYVTKPFNTVELQARVKSQLRRYMQLGGGSIRKDTITIGGIELNDRTKEVTLDGEKVALTRTEYDILKLLMEHPGQVFSPNQIYEQVWNDNPFRNENTVAVHIRHLREKVEYNPAEPRHLKVVWGRGYKMEA